LGYPAITNAMSVRRLTPRECERLQGFPDDFTLIEYKGRPAADGARYRVLGNAMAVPVIDWILGRVKGVAEMFLTGRKVTISHR
jgi:DNA (cytosine-5)-methyltransferase 1